MSDSKKTSLLFSPLKIRGITLKNRIGVSPMVTWTAKDGFVDDFQLVHYGQFALGGAGLIIVEATAVEARGRGTLSDAGIWKDEHIEPWLRITKFLKSQGSVPGIQLAHGGRKSSGKVAWKGRNQLDLKSGGWETIAPSANVFTEGDRVPKEATIADIEEIKSAFVSAAKRSLKAGFEVIELHYAHGYLGNEFLSPITNQRTDKYGGSFENRISFGLEVAEAVRKVLPENVVLGVRVSVTDYVDNGWDVKQTIEFSKQLKKLGVDFIDCSSGGVVSNVNYGPFNTPEVQWKAAKAVQKEAGIPTAAVGKIIDPKVAERLLQEESATLIFIGRAFLNEPHWPYRAADLLADAKTFKYPDSYDWCIGWQALLKWRNDINKDVNNN